MSKKLPKAIVRAVPDAERETEIIPHRQDKSYLTEMDEPGAGGASSLDLDLAEKVVSIAPDRDPPLRAANDLGPTAPKPDDILAIRRQSIARRIVERHANLSAIGGLIPLPIVNVAGVTVIILRMLKELSRLYGVPFERDRARTITIGLMGGSMPSGLASVTTSTLFYLVPGSNLVGMAVSSVTAAACTRSIGRVFIGHFESGATWRDPARS